jgi:hypothetical protein
MKAFNPYTEKWEEGTGQWIAFNSDSGKTHATGFDTSVSCWNWISKHIPEDANGVTEPVRPTWIPKSYDD